MNKFTFVPNIRKFVADDAFTVRVLGKIRTSKELFELLYLLLKFPGYFGFNWNALFDCLRDFHWIKEKKIVIVHDEMPELSLSEMRIYLELLHDAVADWAQDESHSLQVIFDEKDRAYIEALIG